MATSTRQPTSTRVGSATAVLGTLVGLALVFHQLPDTLVPTVVGGAGAAGLVAAVGLAGRTDRTLPAVGACLLFVPAGAGLVGGVSLVALLLVESVFPVEAEALLSVGWLLVASHAAVVVGGSIAVLGLVSSLWPVLDRDSLKQAMRLVLVTGLFPVLVAGSFLFSAVGTDADPDTTLAPPVTALVESLVAPEAAGLHLWSLLALLALGAAGARVVLSRERDGLPTGVGSALEPDSPAHSTRRWQSQLGRLAVVSGGLAVVVLGIETVLAPDVLASAVPALYTAVRALTTLPLLRVGLLVAAAPLLAIAPRRLHDRMTAAGLPAPSVRTLGGLLGGLLTTLVVVGFARRVYSGTVAELVDRFPVGVESEVQDISDSLAGSLGESTTVLLGVVLCLGVAAWAFLLLYFVLRAGLVSGVAPGHSLASVGLFVAVIFASTLGAPAWLVVTGVTTSLLVWDAGRFGARIAHEVGRGSTHTVEFVHVGGTLVAGLVGATVALLVVARLPAGGLGPSPAELLALCSLVAGLLSLVLALR